MMANQLARRIAPRPRAWPESTGKETMKVRIEFNIDNAAFTDGETYDLEEIGTVVREVGARISTHGAQPPVMCQTIHDHNGNDVGRWQIKEVIG